MDGMPILSVDVTAYVTQDLPVVCIADGTKDCLSIHLVDASLMASGKVSQRGDVRADGSRTEISSRACERLPLVWMIRGQAGIMVATSSRRLRLRVVRHQSYRLDAW